MTRQSASKGRPGKLPRPLPSPNLKSPSPIKGMVNHPRPMNGILVAMMVIQNEIEARPDVLVYPTPTLARDTEVTGPITVTLWAATLATDTDFTAKLVDVCEDGCARNLTGGIIRNRQKIEAVIENARRIQSLRDEHVSFCRWFYDTLEGREYSPLAQELRRAFKFMGPESRGCG